MKKLCIYHGNCADGFAAAWVVRKFYDAANVEFHAGVYKNAPPNVAGRDVILVDFTYKRDVLLQMAKTAKSILILDHHKSAQTDLLGIKDVARNITTVFDLDRSGARIAWDYYFPTTPPPVLLRHIEDRDLWRFALADTEAIQANVFSYPYDFAVWDTLMTADVNEMVADGKAITRKHMKDINELLPILTSTMSIGNRLVKVANMSYMMASDAGHILDENEPFSATYYNTPTHRVFSLRSREEGGADVSVIAASYGGGGHANASGFRINYFRVALMAIKTQLHKLCASFLNCK